jgi:hypothetical protein
LLLIEIVIEKAELSVLGSRFSVISSQEEEGRGQTTEVRGRTPEVGGREWGTLLLLVLSIMIGLQRSCHGHRRACNLLRLRRAP